MVLIMTYRLLGATAKLLGTEVATYYGAFNLPEKLYSLEPVKDMANYVSSQFAGLEPEQAIALGILGIGTLVAGVWSFRHANTEPRNLQPQTATFPEYKQEHYPLTREMWYHTDEARQFDRD